MGEGRKGNRKRGKGCSLLRTARKGQHSTIINMLCSPQTSCEWSSMQDSHQGSWISLWFKFTSVTWLLFLLIHYFNPLRDLNLLIYSSLHLSIADVCSMGWMLDRCICTQITCYPCRKIIPDWEWLDEKSPPALPASSGGRDLQGKRRIKPAGQQSEGVQEEQIHKEHELRLSV